MGGMVALAGGNIFVDGVLSFILHPRILALKVVTFSLIPAAKRGALFLSEVPLLVFMGY